MDVTFSGHRFSREQMTLYKGNDIVPLKHTQALLLNFFLNDPEGIHSKEAIMNDVWQGKVVSEQVVFQTISQLRALFGSNAIKTFSKKGYQWQIDIVEESNVEVKTPPIKASERETKTYDFSRWLSVGVVFLVLLSVFLLNTNKDLSSESIELRIVQQSNTESPQESSISTEAAIKISNLEGFNVEFILSKNLSSQSFAAPELAWQQYGLVDNEWLLWTQKFSSAKGTFIKYGLSRDSVYWRGWLFAESDEMLIQQLAERLEQLQQLELFTTFKDELDISAMTSMMEVAPNDPDILLLMANYYFDVQQFEVAMTYAKKLANNSASFDLSPYRAKAQWLSSEIYKRLFKFELATNSLNEMSSTLVDTPLTALKYENIHARAWIAKAQGKFESMYQILDRGLEFGRENGDALMLFELHITYSILAKKAGDDHKKYSHLNEAQALLLKHKLDESNLAVVYYHFAIFTDDLLKAQPYLQKILLLERTTRNSWIIDDAAEKLIDQYIEQENYSAAISLLDEQSETAKHMLSWAKIYQATGKPVEAQSHYEKAFELARLEYNIHWGVHAALALYQINYQHPELQAEYMDYLERNANREWLEEQMKSLVVK